MCFWWFVSASECLLADCAPVLTPRLPPLSLQQQVQSPYSTCFQPFPFKHPSFIFSLHQQAFIRVSSGFTSLKKQNKKPPSHPNCEQHPLLTRGHLWCWNCSEASSASLLPLPLSSFQCYLHLWLLRPVSQGLFLSASGLLRTLLFPCSLDGHGITCLFGLFIRALCWLPRRVCSCTGVIFACWLVVAHHASPRLGFVSSCAVDFARVSPQWLFLLVSFLACALAGLLLSLPELPCHHCSSSHCDLTSCPPLLPSLYPLA